MTQAASAAPPDGAAKAKALETSARALAERHRPLVRAPSSRTRFVEASRVTRALEYAHRHLAVTPGKDAALPRAAEWFLDNYYLIRRVARQIKEDLPPGFARRLPWVGTGGFRVELLAGELVTTMRLELDPASLRSYIAAYQAAAPLTIAELWALPTMLRTCVLRHLVRFLDELHIQIGRAHV